MNLNLKPPEVVHYPPDHAPFGEMVMEKISEYPILYDKPDGRAFVTSFDSMARGGSYSSLLAWQSATWLDRAVGREAAKMFREKDFMQSELERRIHEGIQNARSHAFGGRACWAALGDPQESVLNLDGSFKLHGYYPTYPFDFKKIWGLSLSKIDVSGTKNERVLKQLFHRDKVYATVSDVNVRPEMQSKSLGATLLFHTLGSFNPRRPTTTFVASVNELLINALGEVGYETTGEQQRPDLIEGAEYTETRLQAKSVKLVRERLKAHYPWLLDKTA